MIFKNYFLKLNSCEWLYILNGYYLYLILFFFDILIEIGPMGMRKKISLEMMIRLTYFCLVDRVTQQSKYKSLETYLGLPKGAYATSQSFLNNTRILRNKFLFYILHWWRKKNTRNINKECVKYYDWSNEKYTNK